MKRGTSGFYRRADGQERLWLSPPDIERTMEDALCKAGVFPTDEQPMVDIERLIQELGVRMDQYAELDTAVLGLTEFFPDGPPRISINRDLTGAVDDVVTPPGTLGRWRATMAHEAAHVIMHRVLFEVDQNQDSLFQIEEQKEPQRLMRCLKKHVLFRGGGSDWREVQANMGMAALLMPESVFRRLANDVVEQHNLPISGLIAGTSAASELRGQMAELFGVSRQAAGIRLETVRIVSPAGQTRLSNRAHE